MIMTLIIANFLLLLIIHCVLHTLNVRKKMCDVIYLVYILFIIVQLFIWIQIKVALCELSKGKELYIKNFSNFPVALDYLLQFKRVQMYGRKYMTYLFTKYIMFSSALEFIWRDVKVKQRKVCDKNYINMKLDIKKNPVAPDYWLRFTHFKKCLNKF